MIHTITPNPALDLTYLVEEFKLDDSTRAKAVMRDAGGKGINLSRVAARLNHPTVAMGFTGGRSGDEVRDILKLEGVKTWFNNIKPPTRTNTIIQDNKNQQIRISAPGPEISFAEAEALESSIFSLKSPDFLVLGGSLLPGMPKDFYNRVTKRAVAEGIKVVVDADNENLKQAVENGVFLIKPNQHELERLTGQTISSFQQAIEASQKLLDKVEIVLCSLGAKGAVLISKDHAWVAIPPKVKVDSAVGSGDSLLAGALVALAENKPLTQVLQLAVACGTATATTPGTSLCFKETINEIYGLIGLEPMQIK